MSWRDRAKDAHVETIYVLLEVQKTWPRNDRGRKPLRTRDLDALDAGADPYGDVDGPQVIDGAISAVAALGAGSDAGWAGICGRWLRPRTVCRLRR